MNNNFTNSVNSGQSPQIFQNFDITNIYSVGASKIANGNVVDSFMHSYMHQYTDTPKQSNDNHKKKIKRMKFTPQEDEELIHLVSVYGDQNWKKVSEEMSKENNTKICTRTARQCRDRYVNYLNPDINNVEWTLEEDQCLMLNLVTNQHNFSTIKHLFPGRSEIAIRNRFNYLHRTIIRSLKPTIASGISSINLHQKDGVIEIAKPQSSHQNESYEKNSLISDQNQFLDQFNLHLNPTYLNSMKASIYDLCHENNANINQNSISSSQSISSNKAISYQLFKENTVNIKNCIEKNVLIPQQWIEAAKTIISAAQTDEAKNSISELKQKAEFLARTIESRAFFAQQNKIDSLFNFLSESDHYDDTSMF